MISKADKKWTVGILFVGVLLGVLGGPVSNIVDREFGRYGFWYDLVVILIFLFALLAVYRKLSGIEGK